MQYYVDIRATNANDLNDGSSAKPWKTCKKAFTTAKAGDTVNILAGDYLEDVSVTNDGVAGAPVRFVGLGATIRSIKVQGRKFVELYALKTKGTKVFPAALISAAPSLLMDKTFIDDPTVVINPKEPWSTRQAKVKQKYATYTKAIETFQGLNYSAFSVGIWIKGSSNVVLDNCSASNHTIGIDLDGGSDLVSVRYCVATQCRDGIWSYSGSPTVPSVKNSEIVGCVARNNLNSGITIASGGFGNSMRACSSSNNGIHGIMVAGRAYNNDIVDNTSKNNGWYSEAMQNPGSSAFNAFDVGPGNRFERNLASGQRDVTGIDGNGFIADTGEAVTFVNNVARDCAGSGIALTKSNSCIVLHCTLVNNEDGIRLTESSFNTIGNNILAQNGRAQLQSSGYLNSQTYVDYNVYDGAIAVRDSYDTSKNYATAKAVAAATGNKFELHGRSGDPLLDGDLAPRSGSPAVGCGDPLKMPAIDFHQHNRLITAGAIHQEV